MPMWSMMTNQNSMSPLMENMSSLHDHIMIIMIMIIITTGMMGAMTILQKSFARFSKETQEMEIFWTSIPTIILMTIAIPSLKLLYMTEEPMEPSLSMKIIGHQWYWSYEYSDMEKTSFDSFMTQEIPRNLSTSNFLILPSSTPLRFLVTSNDVIHSWALPSIGMKMDAIPGRINQFNSTITRVSTMSGQCSEICGMKHSFMPINVSSLPLEEFIKSSYMMGKK